MVGCLVGLLRRGSIHVLNMRGFVRERTYGLNIDHISLSPSL